MVQAGFKTVNVCVSVCVCVCVCTIRTFNVAWNSSSNFLPHIEVPPLPVPVGSPV